MTLQTIPHRPLGWARILICFAMAIVFGAFALLHAETSKDAAQDMRLDDVDKTLTSIQTQRDIIRTRRDAQIDSLYEKLSEANSRESRDEGYMCGGFIALGVLQTLGHLRKQKTTP